MTTNNKIFLKGSQKHLNVILYEKEQVPTQKVNHANIVKTDIRGLGTGVGGFSNCATIIETMKGIFTREDQQEQRDELTLRKKLLREIVGAEIDRIKGTTAPTLPSSWKKFETIDPNDSEEEKARKYKHNSLVISKKPYFFRYLYPELNKKFKKYESSYNIISKDLCGIKFRKLLAKKDKTEAEKVLVKRYQKFSPLIVSNCTMNILCKEIENIDFDIKYKAEGINMLPLFEDAGYTIDESKLNIIRSCYRQYNNKKAVKMMEGLLQDIDNEEGKELYYNLVDSVKNDIQQEIFSLRMETPEILFYIGQLAKEYKKFNWTFVWDILEDYIIEMIPQGNTYFPIHNEEGVEYLGFNYILKEVKAQQEEE